MCKFEKAMIGAMAAAAALIATPAAAAPKNIGNAVCQKVTETEAAALAAAGALVASGSTIASTTGLAALSHSSGAAILSSVGVGGTGYLAGTLGGIGATALGFLSAPAVIIGGTVVAVGAGGTYAICKLRR